MNEEPRHRRKHRPGLSRISIACERCRIKKNKCDGILPVCSPCKRAGAECIIVDRLTHRAQPRGHVDALERENEELRRRIQILEQDHASGPRAIGTPSSTPTVPPYGGQTPTDVSLERSALDQTNGEPNTYVGESGGSFFSSLVEKTLMQSGYQNENGPLSTHLRLDLNNQVAADRATFFENFGRVNQSVLPDDLILKLEAAFFDHRWPSLPFLHRLTFREQHLQSFLEHRDKASSTSIFLVLMVLAMGAVDHSRQDRSLTDLPLLCFAVAMGQHFEKTMHNEGLESIQALLLVSWFALNRPCGINAWYAAGQSVRAATAFGLHRQQGLDKLSLLQREMRKRVFWSAYSIDRNVSLALGRPPAIRDTDIDIEIPECLTDEDLLAGVDTNSDTPRSSTPHDTSTFIHIVHLRRLRSRIQDTLYPAKVSCSEDEIQGARRTMHEDLESWTANTPRYNQAKVLTFQTNEWFQITYSQSLLLLYRPSPACPVASQEALQICAENAISLITSYSSLYAKNKMAYTWITLHSLLMASITMLYTLWVSPEIRKQTTPSVVESNIKQCLMLFDVMQGTWPLAARCHDIVQRFGNAALGLWPDGTSLATHKQNAMPNERAIGADYSAWFGLGADGHSQPTHSEREADVDVNNTNETEFVGMDIMAGLDDSIVQDFDINLPLMTDAFGDTATWG